MAIWIGVIAEGIEFDSGLHEERGPLRCFSGSHRSALYSLVGRDVTEKGHSQMETMVARITAGRRAGRRTRSHSGARDTGARAADERMIQGSS